MSAPDWFRSAIAERPEAHCVVVEGAGINWFAWGKVGRPGLLFLPGSAGHAGWWSFVAPFFARDFRVATLSWSGMGASDWRPTYSVSQFSREAMAVAEAAQLLKCDGQTTIVAHSFGAVPALVAARNHGAQIRAAVMVDSRLYAGDKWYTNEPSKRGHRIHPTREQAMARFRLSPTQRVENSYILQYLAEDAIGPAPGGKGWCLRFDRDLRSRTSVGDTTRLIEDVGCPLAFIRGGRSTIVVDEIWNDHQARVRPGTPFIEIPEAGHHVMIDRPLALVTALRTLMASSWLHS